LVNIVLHLLAALSLVPAVVFAVQVLSARTSLPPIRGARPRAVILVPAHDEAQGIAKTLRALLCQMRQGDRVVVVADNCSDDTAAIAVGEGVHVVERRDAARRGKGYALDFGLRHLQEDPAPVIVMIDADCHVETGALDALVCVCAASGRPVQALYLMEGVPPAGLRMRIAQFAWRVRNHVRPLGALNLGVPCQLMGSGMAFPWELIRNAPLASGHIVEDMQLGINLAMCGFPPLFVPQARVTSYFPESFAGADAQRMRWEHGHLSTLLSQGPRLFAQGLSRPDFSLCAMAIDLMVPPLALLALFLSLLAAGQASYAVLAGASWWPTALTLAALLSTLGAAIVAWWGFSRDLLSWSELLAAPWYAARKVPMYLRFVWRRQATWVRAQRDGE
jgi:cellulose synthase/poly-beta-1,6-N-acetylglucosamine synthase-like glycosyltransferase